jgi:hypothetical protein
VLRKKRERHRVVRAQPPCAIDAVETLGASAVKHWPEGQRILSDGEVRIHITSSGAAPSTPDRVRLPDDPHLPKF